MDFSPWVLFVDLGLISGLILIGNIIRARVKFVQELFPASKSYCRFSWTGPGPEWS